ncbi:MAG: tRNA uridine-5-carboxymethylaminomethyl(34) synthesis GTPase MnmE [Magnetococcales bacterium]|nr:tRNA uridine-5-carboxymethylaminomethyl(34) synthesis GTPase MnmE [Magnetococcales bacterium]
MTRSFPAHDDQPIAALATPPGTSAVAIIRMSGSDVLQRLLPLLQRPDGFRASLEDFKPRQLKRMDVTDETTHAPLDQALVVYFPAPHSYTGEDVIELQGHGSPVVVQRILELLSGVGIRPAMPGEFTRRACLNGKMDLTQAEAVVSLINASSLRSAREAVRQIEGSLSIQITNASDRLLTILAHLEANLDFSDEDLSPLPDSGLIREISAVSEMLGALLRQASWGIRLQDGFHLVIVGRPNVGKSSLFNRMLGRKRAIVSATPGTTRDCIESAIEIQGMRITLLDTAGLRYTAEPVEAEGIQLTRERLSQADGVLLVMDAQQGVTEADLELLEDIPADQTLLVWNKMDLYAGSSLSIPVELPAIRVSSETGAGMEILEDHIAKLLLPMSVDGEGVVIMVVRQKEALLRAVQSLAECEAWMIHGKPGELTTMPLRSALDALGEVIGHVTQEDLLDRIFSTFCIGK